MAFFELFAAALLRDLSYKHCGEFLRLGKWPVCLDDGESWVRVRLLFLGFSGVVVVCSRGHHL